MIFTTPPTAPSPSPWRASLRGGTACTFGWQVEGSFMEWDYRITDGRGREIAAISKEIFHLTDTYVIDVHDSADALGALMVVLAIDAEKCSRN